MRPPKVSFNPDGMEFFLRHARNMLPVVSTAEIQLNPSLRQWQKPRAATSSVGSAYPSSLDGSRASSSHFLRRAQLSTSFLALLLYIVWWNKPSNRLRSTEPKQTPITTAYMAVASYADMHQEDLESRRPKFSLVMDLMNRRPRLDYPLLGQVTIRMDHLLYEPKFEGWIHANGRVSCGCSMPRLIPSGHAMPRGQHGGLLAGCSCLYSRHLSFLHPWLGTDHTPPTVEPILVAAPCIANDSRKSPSANP
jgi:hypothetical protein